LSSRALLAVLIPLLHLAAGAALADAVPGSRVALTPPPGFSPSADFAGFVDQPDGASIQVLDFPASAFADLKLGMTKDALAERGMQVTLHERRRVGGYDALWIEGVLPAKTGPLAKWIVAVDAQTATAMVTVNQPVEALTSERRDAITAALRSITIAAQPTVAARDALPYRIEEVQPFVFSRALMGAGMIFEDQGDDSARRADLFVGHSLSDAKVTPDQRSEVARSLLASIDTVNQPEIEQTAPLSQDGLEGVELAAKATDRSSGLPLTIYQALLFDQDRYYRIVGTTSTALAEVNLPKFRQMLASFHRR
jgi:hypothetical protein